MVRSAFAVLVALGAAMFVGTHAAPAADYTLNIGYTPGGDQLAVFVAKEKGFYAKHGIDGTVTRLTTAPTGVQGLVAGSLQLSMTAVPNVLIAVEGGIDLVVVRGLSRFPADLNIQTLLGRTGLGAKNAVDLKGKKIAVPGIYSMGDIMLRKWFLNNGVALNEVTIVELPMPQIPDALRQGSIDAAAIVEPFRSRALDGGAAYQIANYTAKVLPNGPGIIMGALRSWAITNKPAITAFRASIDDAEQFIRDNQPEAREIEKKFLLGASSPIFPPPMSSKVTIQDFEFFKKAGKELGILKGTTDLNSLIIN